MTNSKRQMVVGVIGGGQLARMMVEAASAMGIELRVFAEAEGSSARLGVTRVGDYTNPEQLAGFAEGLDALTFDHEHVPTQLLDQLVQAGTPVYPAPSALIHAQNKLVMRQRLSELGLPMPAWVGASSAAEVDQFIAAHGPKIIVKTPVGGYDGKGVRVIGSSAEVSDWLGSLEKFGGKLLLEQKIEFTRELAILSARNIKGQFKAWPVVQTVQLNGVCSEVIAPAPSLAGEEKSAMRALEIAEKISSALEIVGVFAVEMFEDRDGNLLINELAMRPHNSGHFTIEGSRTSQFEQHLRAVLGLPLGDTAMVGEFSVMINLLGVDGKNAFVENYQTAMAAFPEVKFHSYEKAPRPGRKMGHLTAVGSNLSELLRQTRGAAELLRG